MRQKLDPLRQRHSSGDEMPFSTVSEIVLWNFRWTSRQGGPWLLNEASIAKAFSGREHTCGVYWIGPAAREKHSEFRPKYCGKAVRQPLMKRLSQHARGTGNCHVASYLRSPRNNVVPLRFRFVEISDPRVSNQLEGAEIAAFKEEYVWNGRNEWVQHFAAERR